MKGLLQDLLNTASFGRALSQQVPITNDFLVRSETLCPLPLLCPGILSGLSLCRGCAPCHSLCEFTCVPALLCLDNTVFLGATPTSFGSYDLSTFSSSLTALCLAGRGLTRASYLGLSAPKIHAFLRYSAHQPATAASADGGRVAYWGWETSGGCRETRGAG